MSRAATASSILKRYALTSGGAGLITAPFLGFGLQNTILKRLPVMTGIVGWVVMAGGSAVVTYGLGRTLSEHFEAAGTLADFDVKHLHQAVRHLFGSTAPSTP